MKSVFRFIAITVIIGFTLVSCPEPDPYAPTSGLKYTLINNGTAYSVSKGSANTAIVVIPVVHSGLPVVEIADSGFSSYANLTKVIIPEGVTRIGNYAFFHCSNLKSVTIPVGVTTIGNFAFNNCSSLETIFYGGVDDDAWETITVGTNNLPLADAKKYYFSETDPGVEDTYWRFIGAVPMTWYGDFTSPSGIEMVWVSSGSFELGRNLGTGGGNDVTPISTVNISGFYMGKYQVTQEQYRAVMGNNPSHFKNNPASGEIQNRRPVESVNWYHAIVFCNRLSMMEGLTPAYSISGSTNPSNWGTIPTNISNATWNAVEIVPNSTGYRLPTEAQWEYAAKGGNGSPGNFTYSGSNDPGVVAWYSANSGSRTHEVGKKEPNSLDIYDMSGNVWEWCWDWWGNYTSEEKTDPLGAPSGTGRVIRGGSWGNSSEDVRSVYRYNYWVDPVNRYGDLGFRVSCP